MSPPRQTKEKTKLLEYHRPRSSKSTTYIKDETRKCLRALASYRAPKELRRKAPRSRTAAVLIALFVGRMGDLYVLLSQRASTLRTYAGDTSLPGGKMEDGDRNVEDTARREAFEEIGLSLNKQKVPLLCILEPFLAGNQLLVTPVVVLILDTSLRPVLNQQEVASLFSHPLKSFLTTDPPPFLHGDESHLDEVPYYSYQDIPWFDVDNKQKKRFVRMHRFLTGREAGGVKPVFGFTAAILIRVAMIGYARAPDFEYLAPGQPEMIERIDYALTHSQRFREAFAEERQQASRAQSRRTRSSSSSSRSREKEKRREEGDDLRTARSKL